MPAVRVTYAGTTCPHCHHPLELERLSSGRQSCPRCGRPFEAVRFHPPRRQQRVIEVGSAGPDGAASCASHRRNAAVASCERCGLFMCSLCRTEADGLAMCPACFDHLADEGLLQSARTRFRDYASLAWLSAVTGLLLWLPGLVTGPAALYYGVRALRQMAEWGEVGGRSGVYVAMVLGGASFVQGVVLIVVLAS